VRGCTMSIKKSLVLLLLFYFGCAAYKQLQPDPEISFLENGYIKISDDEDKFELAQGKKYYMEFPRPQNENTYLVLTIDKKPLLLSYLTKSFDKGKGTLLKMADETPQPLTMSVYQVDQTIPLYYWVVDTVRLDLTLDMQYRYIAIWRFKFEQKKEEYESIVEQNTHSRNIYNSIGASLAARDISYSGEQLSLQQQTQKLTDLHSRLEEIEQIFPANILNSTDESYLAYLSLQKNLESEILFQKKYQLALAALSSLSDPRQTLSSFLQKTPDYNSLLSDSSYYQANLIRECRSLIQPRLQDLPGYLQTELRQKQNSDPIPLEMNGVQKLYEQSDLAIPETIVQVDKFVSAFNKRSQALLNSKTELSTLHTAVQNSASWPGDAYYLDRRSELSALRSKIPPTNLEPFGEYQSLNCVSLLHKDVNNFRSSFAATEANYQRAGGLVSEINQYRIQGSYREIIRLLRTNSDLNFLVAQYPDIDDLSVAQQKSSIEESLNQQLWQNAESSLESLYRDDLFVNPARTVPLKNQLVGEYENLLRETVETVSVNNANSLMEQNLSTFSEVDSLYTNQAFFPVHKLTFSSESEEDLAIKNRELAAKLTYIRNEKFPESAIPVLYREFSQNPQDNGVGKARAVVIHGKNYQGQDQKIKNLVAECDPAAAKWITKPASYRKIYALPVTNNRSGNNEYMIRINLQIPSEAQFPVFDVNVKLPEEIARKAGSSQWYNEITFNKKILKNEGRFSITAPGAANDYEVQITPLQVNKTGNNILEIRFNFAAFKVFEVSIMAQKPIIKKF
jgi:hypothetical protein